MQLSKLPLYDLHNYFAILILPYKMHWLMTATLTARWWPNVNIRGTCPQASQAIRVQQNSESLCLQFYTVSQRNTSPFTGRYFVRFVITSSATLRAACPVRVLVCARWLHVCILSDRSSPSSTPNLKFCRLPVRERDGRVVMKHKCSQVAESGGSVRSIVYWIAKWPYVIRLCKSAVFKVLTGTSRTI
jgi:hypothetical protein